MIVVCQTLVKFAAVEQFSMFKHLIDQHLVNEEQVDQAGHKMCWN